MLGAVILWSKYVQNQLWNQQLQVNYICIKKIELWTERKRHGKEVGTKHQTSRRVTMDHIVILPRMHGARPDLKIRLWKVYMLEMG